jgi:deazaflavin-dependent oxidoreductase (nitroreductase family)
MPLPKALARFNRRVTNPVLAPLARRLPGFAIVTHTGRRSGREHRTPVNLFRSGDTYVIALTYGADAQWVRNVEAAGGCEIETRGARIRLVEPRIVHDPRRTRVSAPGPVGAGRDRRRRLHAPEARRGCTSYRFGPMSSSRIATLRRCGCACGRGRPGGNASSQSGP